MRDACFRGDRETERKFQGENREALQVREAIVDPDDEFSLANAAIVVEIDQLPLVASVSV